jgi:hypothetical protein
MPENAGQRRLPEARRRSVLARLLALSGRLRPRLALGPDGIQEVLERPALLLDLDRLLPRFAVTSIQDHSRCGELHCRGDSLVIHNRENLVERGGRTLTRKVNQFSLLQ